MSTVLHATMDVEAARRTGAPAGSRADAPVTGGLAETGRRRRAAADGERGAVTGEFAAALPAAVLMLMLVISLAMHGAAQISLEEGVRAAAREAARGEDQAAAIEAARRVADEDLEISISREGDYVRIRAVRPVRILGLVEVSMEQSAEAEARVEHPSPADGPAGAGGESDGDAS